MSRVSKLLSRSRNKGDKNDAASGNPADLDEEMEKVFAMSEDDKFDLSRFTEDDPENKLQSRYNEKELSSTHRKKTYPHIHLPIKGRTHSSRRANFNNFVVDDTKTERIAEEKPNGDDSDGLETARKGSVYFDDSTKEPALSERAAITIRDSSPDRRVQFVIGENKDASSKNTDENESHKSLTDHKVKRKHSHHHKKSRKHVANGDSNKARKLSTNDEQDDDSYQVILQLEEPLQEFVQDDVASHRFDCSRDKRRFSTKSAISSVFNNRQPSIKSSLPIKLPKRYFDHSPHEVFVQLDELVGVGDDLEWKETARWIKYEEDVVEGADRWGRPHVGSLSFHSLLNLRRCLETGVVLLDLEEKELPGIAYRVVEQMVTDQLITEQEKGDVMRALLFRHRHVNEHERFRFMRRNTASYSSLQGMDEVVHGPATHVNHNNLSEDQKHRSKPSVCSVDFSFNMKNLNHNIEALKAKDISVDMKEETYLSSTEELDRKFQKEKERLLKRIPPGAEATTVLVGTVDFLTSPAIAFVRLAEGILLPAVTEVTIPVRFIFILLGPLKLEIDYREVGRSMATLMSNSDFNKKAYKAPDRRDLQRAINDFLDSSIVLPPGNWETDALLSLKELRAKNDAIRKRRSIKETDPAVIKALLSGDGDKEEEKSEDPFGDPLRRTRKCFGGLINDVKRRFPYYKSDYTDGLNSQCLSAAIFMYFAALSAAITFGGLYASKTRNKIGVSETLVSTSVAGIIFNLFAGQPLIIIGSTGPLLLFDEALFKFCRENGIDYLTMRVYIGAWLLFIALLVASVEGSVFIKVFTRFTEEIFASLISLLYIFESVTNLIAVFQRHPLLELSEYCAYENSTHVNATNANGTCSNTTADSSGYFNGTTDFIATPLNFTFCNSTATNNAMPDIVVRNQPNSALFCMILSLGTFFLAYYLRHFRNSKFLGRSVRRALGDFGVPIAIIVMGFLAAVPSSTFTEKLKVPEGLTPTQPDRSWLVPPVPFPVWAMFASFVPAILVYILVFMETHISELIIGKKERKLKKGCGFHLDIVLVCLTNVGCGMIGAPWMCAATVRSVSHVSSVTLMSTTHAPGEKPHIITVKEQRVSALVVAVLVGVSVSMASILSVLPMAILFGVFLYMGISSIEGIQFIERLKLFLMPAKHHPQTAYVRKVSTIKMYLFTSIQLGCLTILWIIKSSQFSLLFPFFLVLMIPLRAQLGHVFSPAELRALDSDEPDAIDKEDDEPDFYAQSLLPG